MANIGDHFSQAENGWKRVELESARSVKLNGFTVNSRNYGSKGTVLWNSGSVKGEYVEFIVDASRIRLLGLRTDDSGTANIYINDVMVESNVDFNGGDRAASTSNPYCTLQWQFDLDKEEHVKIKIESNGDGYLYLDIIDYVGRAMTGDQLLQPEQGWKRLDNSNTAIQYDGSWTHDSSHSPECYNGTESYTNQSGIARFSFFGNKLRIISRQHSNRSTMNIITIDGVDYEYSENNMTSKFQVVVFEKLDLDNTAHVVTIKSKTNDGYTTVDCIDIDVDGYIISLPGQQILQPEQGWRRYDEKYKGLRYKGAWEDYVGSDVKYCYNSTLKHTNDYNATINFSFSGTKIRIIDRTSPSYRASLSYITIDGEKHTFTTTIKDGYQILVFEKLNLSNSIHTVEIGNESKDNYISLDAIDIDEGGQIIVPPAEIGDSLPDPEQGWKRIDDTDSNISYNGGEWLTHTYPEYYKTTSHYSTAENSTINIRFFGTKFRFISSIFENKTKRCSINIDGVEYDEISLYHETYNVKTALVFSVENLDKKMHNVIISKKDNAQLFIDAIDIDEDGYTTPAIGSSLPIPEKNWNRFDDLDSLVLYEGLSWKNEVSSTSYDKTIKVSTKPNEYYQFDCISSGIRLISILDNTYPNTNNISIFIDDIEIHAISQYNTQSKNQILLYEYIFNTISKHTIKVVNNSSKMSIDCIDIKEGILLPTLSRDYEFPVAIIEQHELDGYCASLVNKEEQLLITPKGDMYLTNGEGGYSSCGANRLIDDNNITSSSTWSSDKINSVLLQTRESLIDAINKYTLI